MNTNIDCNSDCASETRSMVVVIVPGPAVRGNARGMMATLSYSPCVCCLFFGASISSATLTNRMPPAILKAAGVMRKIEKRRCPVNAKNASTINDIFMDFLATSMRSCSLMSSVRLM